MTDYNKNIGKLGEEMALDYLKKNKYTILKRNFRVKGGEIDIIAQDGDILVFVEVKAKIGPDFGLPEEMVGRGKLQKIRNMATIYMKGRVVACRIDVVAIVLNENNEVQRLTHHENVY